MERQKVELSQAGVWDKGLSLLIQDVIARRSITGLSISEQSPTISHLFFADDSLVFIRANYVECFILSNLLRKYEEASSQCINFEKSIVCFSFNISCERGAYLQSILNVRMVDNLGLYLGLPSIFSRRKRVDFSKIKDRIWKVMQGWKMSFFSMGEGGLD